MLIIKKKILICIRIYRRCDFQRFPLATRKSISTALSAQTYISNAFLVVVVVVAVAVSQAVSHDCFAGNAANLLHLVPSHSVRSRRLHQLSSLCKPPRILCACGCAFDAAAIAIAFVAVNVAINALAGPVSLFAFSLFAFLRTVSIAFLFKCKNKGKSKKKKQKRKSERKQAAITTKSMNWPQPALP